MNNWDLNNFHFIMNLSEAEFDEWMQSISDDDVQYAIELIRAARAETETNIQTLEDEDMDLTAAQSVLAKFRL